MMRYIITCILLISFIPFANGQTPSSKKAKRWTIKVFTVQGAVIKGTFLRSDSDSIWVTTQTNLQMPAYSFSVAAEQLYKIKFRRKGSAAIGFGMGLAAGVAVGVYLGSTTPEDYLHPNRKKDAMTKGGFLLGGIFSITGAILGTSYTEKYFIGGNRNEYLKYSEKFRDHGLQ